METQVFPQDMSWGPFCLFLPKLGEVERHVVYVRECVRATGHVCVCVWCEGQSAIVFHREVALAGGPISAALAGSHRLEPAGLVDSHHPPHSHQPDPLSASGSSRRERREACARLEARQKGRRATQAFPCSQVYLKHSPHYTGFYTNPDSVHTAHKQALLSVHVPSACQPPEQAAGRA